MHIDIDFDMFYEEVKLNYSFHDFDFYDALAVTYEVMA